MESIVPQFSFWLDGSGGRPPPLPQKQKRREGGAPRLSWALRIVL
jgi:hypothetical protein